MEKGPLGIFDSGLGGLTALRALRGLLPGEDLVYFGDTGRMPYGGRAPKELSLMAEQNIAFLKSLDARQILAACGTVSSSVLPVYPGDFGLPVHGVVIPAAQKAAALAPKGHIGVIATEATVRSGAFKSRIAELAPEADVVCVACPRLVPLVEANRLTLDDPELKEALAEYLDTLQNPDVLILGCTHYSLLWEPIEELTGGKIVLVGAAEEAAAVLAARLEGDGPSAGPKGRLQFFTSGDVSTFEAAAGRFLGFPVDGLVQYIAPQPL